MITKNIIKYSILFCLFINIASCKSYFELVIRQYKASKYVRNAIEHHIDDCLDEYYKYHPNAYNLDIRSKICSRVKNRMCVLNKYCKGDKECIKITWWAYPVWGGELRNKRGSGEEYCQAFVKEIMNDNIKNQTFKGYYYCKTKNRDEEFCKKHGL